MNKRRNMKHIRFEGEANLVYQMPRERFEAVKEAPIGLFEIAYKFMNHHVSFQVPRLNKLMDYYEAQGRIKKWAGPKNPHSAHNRISSAFARYITNLRVGYFLGNDIQYKVTPYEDSNQSLADDLEQLLTDYNQSSDEAYIDEMIKKDLSITGRAYDLVFANEGDTTLNLAKIDPTTAFVVYDDSIKAKPLFAVRYYQTGILNEDLVEQYEIYTDEFLYKFHTDGGLPNSNAPVDNAVLDESIPLFFGRVPLTEYANNEERMGDWEPELDHLDALDMAVSTMANFQEDFNSAALVATGEFARKTDPVYKQDDNGNIMRDKSGNPIIEIPPHPIIHTNDRIYWLKPYLERTGVDGSKQLVMPSLQYLTKQYDSTGWSTYTNFLINEIHKYTNSPNVNDPNFASNASGVAMSYKLWGSDQERKVQEALFKKSLKGRLSATVHYWIAKSDLKASIKDEDSVVAMISPNFMPNLPKNDDATAQLIQILQATNLFSAETMREMAEPITEVSADAEQQRVDDQEKHRADLDSQQQSGDFGIGRIFSDGKLPNEAPDEDEN